jgi:hypothetical protein
LRIPKRIFDIIHYQQIESSRSQSFLLGNALAGKAPALRIRRIHNILIFNIKIFVPHTQSRSFARKCVPKPEFGNEFGLFCDLLIINYPFIRKG